MGTNNDARIAAIISQQQSDARVHYQSLTTAVWLPIMQSVIYGFLSALLVALLAWYLGWAYPLRWFLMAWVLVAFLRYHIGLDRWWYIVNSVEQVFNLDLDREGTIGGEPEKQVTLRLEVSRNEGRILRFGEFNVPTWKMTRYARAILDGKPNTEVEWCGRGRLFSEDEYREMRDQFIGLQLAFWHNDAHHDQGWSFNDDGLVGLEDIAHMRLPNL